MSDNTQEARIGTWRNAEHTGSRNDLSLSGAMRQVVGVKHLDQDLMQIDPKTYDVEICFEATSEMGYKATFFTRKLAKKLGAYAFLVQHEWHDHKQEFPIYLTIWDRKGKIDNNFRAEKMEWEDLVDICKQVHEIFVEDRTTNQEKEGKR